MLRFVDFLQIAQHLPLHFAIPVRQIQKSFGHYMIHDQEVRTDHVGEVRRIVLPGRRDGAFGGNVR